MKRILFVTNSLGFAGAEKMLVFVANSLSERGYCCSIANLNRVGDYINEKRQEVNDEIAVCDFGKPPQGKSRHVYFLSQLYEAAKEFKADVIIGFTGFPSFYAKIIGDLLRIPSIMSERGDPARTRPNTIKAKIILSVINGSRGGVFQTDGASAYYGKGLRNRGIVIPNPIFIKTEVRNVPFENRQKTVVSVGRLDNEQKRYDVMIDAFKLFSQKHPEYVLKLYGRGEDEERIKEWVVNAGLSDNVKFMGLSQNPMQDISEDGIFIITSDFEGISNSLLEAMAIGLPCVSTDHTPGGARLLIKDHENGLLAPIGDSVALAKALCEFADDPLLAQKCGRNARSVIFRFAPNKMIDMWEEYILKICE